MPDATGLELPAGDLGDAALETVYFRGQATIEVDPAQIRAVLERLRGKGYAFMASVHGVDYYPHEPRLGVIYELLDMAKVDRITVKLRLPSDAATVASVTPDSEEGAGWATP